MTLEKRLFRLLLIGGNGLFAVVNACGIFNDPSNILAGVLVGANTLAVACMLASEKEPIP